MSKPITGVDVSSWQHIDGQPIDWEKVEATGNRFAVVKATQGTGYVNPWIARDLSDALAAGLLIGAYHYYEAGEDPQAQAKWFMSCIQGQPLDLGAFIDWECYFPKEFVHTQELSQCLAEARLVRPQTGVYCNADWAAILQKESLNLGRLWVAAWSEKPAFACFMWQRSGSGVVDGIKGEVDLDVIENTRGLDIPTAPRAERPAEPLYSLKEAEDAEEAEETGPREDHEGSDS